MKYLVLIINILLFCSCKKFLDERPDKKMNVPSTIEDLQNLLDNYRGFNTHSLTYPEIMSDDYYLTSADWNSLSSETTRNLYIWQADENTNAYGTLYQSIYYANVVLDHLDDVQSKPAQVDARDNVEGSALFFRSFFLFEAASQFAKPYNGSTASNDLGIPLRLNSDFAEPSVRSSVQQTYQQIISDLKKAADLLPRYPFEKTRPSKPAAYAALARTYLSMREYDSAGLYAGKTLALYDSLLDYNTLNSSASLPVSMFNREVIFHCTSLGDAALAQSRWKVDSALYLSYKPGDLRRSAFFKPVAGGSYTFKGNYSGQAGTVFTGLTTAEMYLIRAESNARAGETVLAMQDLNTLLESRWLAGDFTQLSASSAADALEKILLERRKELLMRGLRWTDLRRFTFEQALTVVPKRIIDNKFYQLEPSSPRYVLKFPLTAIDRSSMQQNP